MSRLKHAGVAMLVAVGMVSAQVQIAGRPYAKLSTRAATRAAMVAQLSGEGATWGPWHMLAPLDEPGGGKGIEKPHAPEDELGAMRAGGAGPDFTRSFEGKGGKRVTWHDVEREPDVGGAGGPAPLDFNRGLAEAERTNAVGYLHRSISADKARDLPVVMGADDGLRVWFNGELLISEPREAPLDPESDRAVLHLKPGINHLLVKVTQSGGRWEFQLSDRIRVDPFAEAALDWQLDNDFPDAEARYFRIATVPYPKELSVEVGGLDVLPGTPGAPGDPIFCTRRGEVFIVDNAYELPPLRAKFRRFAGGLQEPLGLRVLSTFPLRIALVQRSELTEVADLSGSGTADLFRTICDAWRISGNYHEYAFGPKLDRDGQMWVTLNLAHTGGETVMGTTIPTRGWAVKIDPQTGIMTKVADGLRSPDGIGMNAEGDMFYTDNQGDYVATNKLCHLKMGAFYGHQASLKFRDGYGPDWRKNGRPVPEITPPAVWFPYQKMGQSASDIVLDDTGGAFGPFAGQLFVGDQTYPEVFRVFLEKVAAPDGTLEYQGACFPFKKGFESGVHRMAMAPADSTGRASMFVGMTDRGWGSTGPKREGLQRLIWTGAAPFEVRQMRIKHDGFELEFTRDLGPSAAAADSYRMSSYTYEYHPDYGSKEMDTATVTITAAEQAGPRTVRLRIDALKTGPMGYVHELSMPGVRDASGEPLLHTVAYYTVQRIPTGGAQNAPADSASPR